MRKLFMAMVVLLTTTAAYASPTDGGVVDAGAKAKIMTPDQLPGQSAKPATKCDGILVNSVEALGFNTSFNVLIIVASATLNDNEHKPITSLIPEQDELRDVSILKRTDAIVKLKDVEHDHCLTVSREEATGLFQDMFKLASVIEQYHTNADYDQFFILVAKDEQTARTLVGAANSFVGKLGKRLKQ